MDKRTKRTRQKFFIRSGGIGNENLKASCEIILPPLIKVFYSSIFAFFRIRSDCYVLEILMNET